MVTAELARLEARLRSGELIEGEIAATSLALAGREGTRLLAAIAMDSRAAAASRLTALRHLPAGEDALPVLRRLLEDPLPALRYGALARIERDRALPLIPLVRRLTSDPATFWDLDEEISIGAIARRVLESLSPG